MGAGAIHGHQEPNHQFTSPSLSLSPPLSPHHFSTTSSDCRHSDTTQDTSNISRSKSSNTMKMSCERCSSNFTFFKRKKFCRECHRYFCSSCLPKPPSSSPAGRQCQKCLLLISGHFTRDDLQDWKIKDIRCFLDVRKVSTKGCREKHDLVELVLSQFCKERRNSLERQAEHDLLVQQMAAHLTMDTGRSPSTPSTQEGSDEASGASSSRAESSSSAARQTTGENDDHPDLARVNRMSSQEFRNFLQNQLEEILNSELSSQRDTQTAQESTPSSQTPIRLHLDKVETLEEIDQLSVRQLKELLVTNFVDFKGCCEKPELIQRVKRLWSDHQENKVKAERIHKADEDAAVAAKSPQSQSRLEDSPTNAPVSSSSKHAVEIGSSQEETVKKEHLTPSNTSSKTEASPSKHMPAATDDPGDSLCRVCMDSLINCILLECGHMVTCTTCGKQLAECPICRQYISRVVRVFRS